MFPRVTAVLVVRHGGDHLERTLDAIRAQVRTPDAFVVVLAQADSVPASSARPRAPPIWCNCRSRSRSARPSGRGAGARDADLRRRRAVAARRGLRTGAGRSRRSSPPSRRRSPSRWPVRSPWIGRSPTASPASAARSRGSVGACRSSPTSSTRASTTVSATCSASIRRPSWSGTASGRPSTGSIPHSDRRRRARPRRAGPPRGPPRRRCARCAGPVRGGRRRRSTRRRPGAHTPAELPRRAGRAAAPPPRVRTGTGGAVPLAELPPARDPALRPPAAREAARRDPREFAAALATMFSGVRVARARRVLKSSRTVGWSAIAPLRLQPDELRRRRQAAAEARRARARGRSNELQFIGTGGGWVLLATSAASVGLFSWLIGSGGVGGGGLLPLSGVRRALAQRRLRLARHRHGLRRRRRPVQRRAGSARLAHVLVAVLRRGAALARRDAGCRDRRLVRRLPVDRARLLRAVAALLWVSPRRSSRRSRTAARAPSDARAARLARVRGLRRRHVVGGGRDGLPLFAAVIAAAPSLAPALVIGWIVALAVSGRAAVRLVGLPIPALVLALPLIVEQVGRGTPLGLLADPGPARRRPGADRLAARPRPAERWMGRLGRARDGFTSLDPRVVATVLAVPLVLAALASTLRAGWRRAVPRPRRRAARIRHRGRGDARVRRHRGPRCAGLGRRRAEPRLARARARGGVRARTRSAAARPPSAPSSWSCRSWRWCRSRSRSRRMRCRSPRRASGPSPPTSSPRRRPTRA